MQCWNRMGGMRDDVDHGQRDLLYARQSSGCSVRGWFLSRLEVSIPLPLLGSNFSKIILLIFSFSRSVLLYCSFPFRNSDFFTLSRRRRRWNFSKFRNFSFPILPDAFWCWSFLYCSVWFRSSGFRLSCPGPGVGFSKISIFFFSPSFFFFFFFLETWGVLVRSSSALEYSGGHGRPGMRIRSKFKVHLRYVIKDFSPLCFQNLNPVKIGAWLWSKIRVYVPLCMLKAR